MLLSDSKLFLVHHRLSTSGNSKNIVNAIEVAKAIGAGTLSMTGERTSRLSEISDVTIRLTLALYIMKKLLVVS